MPAPADWDAAAAVAARPAIAWRGRAWRAHKREFLPTDPGGALRFSGRYNRGLDEFPEDEVWPALYAGLAPDVALGEILRHMTPQSLPSLVNYRISELALALAAVLDCRDVSAMGLSIEDLCDDHDYELPQALAAAAIARGVEAIFVPSCTRLGDNLVVLPTRLRPGSRIRVVSSRDPRLYVPRPR